MRAGGDSGAGRRAEDAADEPLTSAAPAAAARGAASQPGTPRRRPNAFASRLRIEGGPVTLAVVAVVLSGLYALGALLPFWYLDSPEEGAAFFPAAGLTLAVLLLSPRRTWPLWLAVVAATELAVDLTHGQNLTLALGFAAANTIEPLVGASGIRRGRRRPASFPTWMVRFLLWGVVIGPFVGGLIGATTAVVFGDGAHFLSTAGKWWLGDALGVLVVATPILAWSNKTPYEAAARPAEVVAMVAVGTAITLVPSLVWDHRMLYALLPVFVWAALRGGSRAVSAVGIGIAFAADWAAVTGRSSDLLAPGEAGEQLVFVQVFIAVTLLAALILAVQVAERRRLEAVAHRAELKQVEAERAAVDSADQERRRIARETHDIVGHALSVMLLQAGAARRALDSDAASARELLETVESVGRVAFRELDVALALDGEAADHSIERGLGDITELVELMRRAGLDVTLDLRGEPRVLSPDLDRSAYLILQEALTNITRHARSGTSHVTIGFDDASVSLSIVSLGGDPAPSQAEPAGRGLTNMRERAELLGGDVEIGSRNGTFVVRAHLPERPAAPSG